MSSTARRIRGTCALTPATAEIWPPTRKLSSTRRTSFAGRALPSNTANSANEFAARAASRCASADAARLEEGSLERVELGDPDEQFKRLELGVLNELDPNEASAVEVDGCSVR